MKKLTKTIITLGLISLLSACAYDPVMDGYYGSSNSNYGQRPNYGYQDGYSYYNNGYSGYRQSPYGYNNGGNRPYCPEDDDD